MYELFTETDCIASPTEKIFFHQKGQKAMERSRCSNSFIWQTLKPGALLDSMFLSTLCTVQCTEEHTPGAKENPYRNI